MPRVLLTLSIVNLLFLFTELAFNVLNQVFRGLGWF